MLLFSSDYMEGMHPQILKKLTEINLEKNTGYGQDDYCRSARDKIRRACNCPQAEVEFLVGGTQTNATVIDGILKSYQGVVAADTGHINVHEAGAIEFGGHKVLPLPNRDGKIQAECLAQYLAGFYADGNHEHMVMPGMVYLSHPTEYGTLYTRGELEAIHAVCLQYQIPLYVDGARLGYGLAADGTDVTLEVLAHTCDAFYIGGTKVGALLGEAVVLPNPELIPHFFTIIKQHGALLAKGWVLGVQFDALFTDGLYEKIGRNGVEMAALLQKILKSKGYQLLFESPTNQVFVILENRKMEELSRHAGFSFWEKRDDSHTVVRFATSWATTREQINQLSELL